jgi:hypothetical protein
MIPAANPKGIRHVCQQDEPENYSQIYIPISFMPGKEKCLKNKTNSSRNREYYYYRDLKEFIINKNAQYCLWGSEFWDEECQDSSMKYAYNFYDNYHSDNGEVYKKYKLLVINFIKYIQNNNIEEVLKLLDYQTMFFTDDDANCLKRKEGKSMKKVGCRAYFNKNHKNSKREDNFNFEACGLPTA